MAFLAWVHELRKRDKSKSFLGSLLFISSLVGSPALYLVGSVVEWLKRRDYDQHGLGSKPIRAFLLCHW